MKLLLAESAIQVDNAPSNDNVTPLYSACFNGHLEVVRYLLRDGRADVKYVTNPNETGTDPLYPLRPSFFFVLVASSTMTWCVMPFLVGERVDAISPRPLCSRSGLHPCCILL